MALRSVSRKSLSLGLAVGHIHGLQSFSLPELPYDYGALELVISEEFGILHLRIELRYKNEFSLF